MFGDAGLWKESQVISSIIVVGGMLAAIGVLARSFRRPVQAEDASLWRMFAVVSAMIFGAVVNFRWPNPGPSVLALFAYPCIAVGACLCIAIRLWQNDRRAKARSITRTALMWGLLWNGFITMQFVIASPRTHSGPSRALQGLNNMRQVGIALQWFASSNNGQLPASVSGQPPMSWRVAVLPALDESTLFKTYRKDIAWNVEPNASIARVKQEAFLCPEHRPRKDAVGHYYSSFTLITGPETIFPPEGGPLSLGEIGTGDGTTQTLLLVEASGQKIVWTEPRNIDLTPQPIPGGNKKEPPDLKNLMSWHHSGGAHVIFADGSGRTLSKNIDPNVLKALTSPKGGEDVSAAKY